MWTIFFQDKTNTSLIFEQPVFFRFALWKVVQHFLQGIQLVREKKELVTLMRFKLI